MPIDRKLALSYTSLGVMFIGKSCTGILYLAVNHTTINGVLEEH